MPMVAVCDILDFKGLVRRLPLQRVVDDYLEFLRCALHSSVHQDSTPTVTPTLEDIRDQSHVGVAWFSDTILLYGHDESPETNERIIDCVGRLLFQTVRTPGTRLRAGISFGEVHCDPENDVYVGQAIVDAYQLEQAQQWSGGALTDSARAHALRDSPWLVQYEVPIKNGSGMTVIFPTLAVNWTHGVHPREYFPTQWAETSPDPPFAALMSQPDVVLKWINTRRFHDTVCQYCR